MRKKMVAILLSAAMIMQPVSTVCAADMDSEAITEDLFTSEETIQDDNNPGTDEAADEFGDGESFSSEAVVPFVSSSGKNEGMEENIAGKSAASDSEIIAQGSCGETQNWTLDSEGVLRISGTGAMTCDQPAPWSDYREKIKSVIIENGVRSIGYKSFLSCSALTSVTIPDSVWYISSNAFEKCSALTEITIPDSVDYLEPGTFEDCVSLKKVNFPQNFTKIGRFAFFGCTGMESISIPDSVTSIGDSAFAKCSSLKEIVIPRGVTEIEDYTFEKCSNLKKIVLPDNLTRIGETAFFECTSLSGISIPDSVTEIGEVAFSGCSSLTDVKLSNSLTQIPKVAFGDCTSLKRIIIPDGVTSLGENVFQQCENLESVIIPDSMKSIGWACFYRCSKLKEIELPDSVTEIDDTSFNECTNLTICGTPGTFIEEYAGKNKIPFRGNGSSSGKCGDNVNWRLDSTGILTISGTGAMAEYKNETEVPWYGQRETLKSVTIKEGVTGIGTNTFKGCTNLTEITIPESVVNIGKDAFAYCSKVTLHVIMDSYGEKYAKENNISFQMLETAHNFIPVETKEPTCTEKGYTTYKCTGCGKTYTEEKDALGHKWNKDYTIDRDATYLQEGQKSIHCSVCGQIKEDSIETIPKTEGFLSGDKLVPSDVSSPSPGCSLAGLQGKYVVQIDEALNRINEIRMEACREGVINPSTGKPLTPKDYVPIRWSSDLEYIARIRAAEASLTLGHVRTNGKSCFNLKSPGSVYSQGEVLAWTWAGTMVAGINLWYTEKDAWVKQDSSKVTGHYTQMIDPSHLYVGLGTFCSDIAPARNTTAGEFSSYTGLDETRGTGIDDCIQVLDISNKFLLPEYHISGASSGKPGDQTQLELTVDAKVNGNDIKGLKVLKSVTWTSSNDKIASVNQNGRVTAKSAGTVQITAQDADGNKGNFTFTVESDHNNPPTTDPSEEGNHNNPPTTDPSEEENHTHTPVADPAVEATCTNPGRTQGSHCSVCGAVLEEQKEIPVTEHKWGAWATISKATVLAPEKQSRTCSICRKQETKSVGEKLSPTAKLNYTSLKLKTGQTTGVVKISGLAEGDSVKSWKSSNKKIVKVDSKGKIVAQKTSGTAYVTATLASGKTVKVKITVQKSAVKTKNLTGLKKSLSLKKGKTATLKPVRNPITSTEKITYVSSNKKVVTVSSKGVVKAIAPGEAKITVKCGSARFVIKVTVPKTKKAARS